MISIVNTECHVPKTFSDLAKIAAWGRLGQERWHAIGLVRGILILTVVHTLPTGDDENSIRIISARKATADERKRYEAQDD